MEHFAPIQNNPKLGLRFSVGFGLALSVIGGAVMNGGSAWASDLELKPEGDASGLISIHEISLLNRPTLRRTPFLRPITPLLQPQAQSAEQRKAAKDKTGSVAPTWARSGLENQAVNVSYLARYGEDEEGFNDQFFDSRASVETMREYERQVIANEERENAGLEEAYDEEARFKSMKDRARHAIRSAYKRRLRSNGKALGQMLENMPDEIRDPLAVIAAAASLYNGQQIAFELMEGIKVTSRAALRRKEASFSMNLYDTGLSSTVYYNRHDNVAATLTQRLTPEVSAVLNSAHSGSAQFVYSLSF
jgi:hypothetical protein